MEGALKILITPQFESYIFHKNEATALQKGKLDSKYFNMRQQFS